MIERGENHVIGVSWRLSTGMVLYKLQVMDWSLLDALKDFQLVDWLKDSLTMLVCPASHGDCFGERILNEL